MASATIINLHEAQMVNGVPEVRAMFARKGAAVVAAGKAAAAKGGGQVADVMRFLAPVDDGELKSSIRVEDATSLATRGGGKTGFIGVIVKAGDANTVVTNNSGGVFQNARLQEFGTKTRPANPYFFPAWRTNRTRVRASISRAVRKAWRNG